MNKKSENFYIVLFFLLIFLAVHVLLMTGISCNIENNKRCNFKWMYKKMV